MKDEKMMPFWDHVAELRTRIKTSLWVFIIAFFPTITLWLPRAFGY